MPKPVYRLRPTSVLKNAAIRLFSIVTVGSGVIYTVYCISILGKYLLFDKPEYARQQSIYAKALVFKEEREKQLGLRE